MSIDQPPFDPPAPWREDPTVESSTTYTVAGVTVIYQLASNEAHRLVIGADVGEWYAPRYPATVTSGGVDYVALSQVEYERYEERIPRVFVAKTVQEDTVTEFDITWTTALLAAGDSELHTVDTEADLGEACDIVLITSIQVTQLDANGDAVSVWSTLDGAAVPDVYLIGDGITPAIPGGVGDSAFGPVITGAVPGTAAKPIRNNTSNNRIYVRVENDVGASGAGRYTVRMRGLVVGSY